MAQTQIEVLIVTPEKVIYEGEATSIILPGERGVFEVMAYHKHLLSRLLRGKVTMDGRVLPIKRGVAKVALNKVTVIVEEDAE